MTRPSRRTLDALRARHDAVWRDPAAVASQWEQAGEVDPRLLVHRVRGAFWETLADAGVTLVVSREYEHLLLALGAAHGRPQVTYMALPHPSGVAIDRRRGVVHVASTRNPNQVFDLMPVRALAGAHNGTTTAVAGPPLVPVRSRFLPGRLYLHDLAFVGGRLHANAVGQNAIVRLDDDGGYTRVWWPRCIETPRGPVFGRNHLQLNSIAAGPDLRRSFFSASCADISARRPGHRNFPVDGRGVIFSGATREPIATGLTRPHSARLARGKLWVDNSGYGELAIVRDGGIAPLVRLPGWTRGLGFHGKLAFVGTSRVLPRFRQYAPGLDVDRSVCGVHAVDTDSGRVLGSLTWPFGNQIFAVDWMPASLAAGFPFRAGARRATRRETRLFSAFLTDLARENTTHGR